MQMNKGITLVIVLLFAVHLFCACGGSDGGGDDEPVVVDVTSVDLSQTTLSMKVGEQTTLTVRVSPTNATNKIVSWSSSQTSVATVSSNGQVTAIGKGSCVITATAGGKSAQCTVTVNDVVVDVTSVTLSETSLSLEVGKSSTLTATVSPSNATDKTVIWESSDASVATVDNGVVKAVKAGAATITATAGGKSATCTVKVKQISGFSADINSWDEDGEDYGGIVK